MKIYFRFKVFVIIFCAISLTAVGATAQEQSSTLEEMVITATKTEKKITEAPASVTVVTRAEMQRRNVKTVDGALAEFPGLFVKRTKGLMDSTSSVKLRGFNGDEYTLVLLDGLPLNDAYTGGVEWSSLPVDNIERIEVIRGPASALYGGNAMGGVINIITKTPQKLSASAGGGYGTNETARYRLSVGDRFWDKLSLRLGYEQQSTDGYPTTPVVVGLDDGPGNRAGGYPMDDKKGEPKKWVVGDKGDNGAEQSSFNGKLRLDFSPTGHIAFTAISARHEYDYGRPNTLMGTFGDDDSAAIAGGGRQAEFSPNDFINYTGISENKTDSFIFAAEEVLGPVTLHLQTGMVQKDDRYTLEEGSGMEDYDTSEGSLNINRNSSWFGEVRGDVALTDAHLLTLGTSYRADKSDMDEYEVPFYRSFNNKSESLYYSGGKARTWALFAQDEWQLRDNLILYLGVRFDSWEVYDGASGETGDQIHYEDNTQSALSPKVAAVYQPLAQTTLRASVGKAYRPPTLYELYRTWQSYSTLYESNPDLDPETVLAYELGVDQFFFDGRTRISLTGFRNDIDDLIYYQSSENAEGDTVKHRINAGKARTYGMELELSQTLTEWLNLWTNVTLTDARIIENSTDPDSEDKRVTGIPKTVWNIGLDAEYRWVTAGLVSRYYSKIYGDEDNGDVAEGVYSTYEPFFTVDAKVSIEPLDWVRISLSADNIFDEQYYEYYQTEGQTYFAELTLKY